MGGLQRSNGCVVRAEIYARCGGGGRSRSRLRLTVAFAHRGSGDAFLFARHVLTHSCPSTHTHTHTYTHTHRTSDIAIDIVQGGTHTRTHARARARDRSTRISPPAPQRSDDYDSYIDSHTNRSPALVCREIDVPIAPNSHCLAGLARRV